MHRRLLTFIGTPSPGVYQPARYTWGDASTGETSFVAEALCRLLDFNGDDEVCIACTDDAWSWRGRDGQRDDGLGPRLVNRLADLGVPAARVPRPLPAQAHERALWEHFAVLRDAIVRSGADEVIVDVTHGFRATPVLATAVLAHARVVPPGLPAQVRMVYGAYDSPLPDGRRPVWDLTGLLMLNDWTRMLTHLVESGRVVEVDDLIKQVGGARYRQWRAEGRPGPPPSLAALAGALQRFGDDIATLRLVPPHHGGAGIIGHQGSAAKLIHAAGVAARDLSAEMAPLADALDALVDQLRPLDCGDPTLDPGIDALRHLARLYVSWDRLPEAATVLREGMISARCDPADRAPGTPGVRQRRERHSPRRAGELFQARNDILHAGFGPHPRKPGRLRKAIAEGVDRLHPVDRSDEHASAGIFVNLSNHPSDRWSDSQRRAALSLSHRVVDLAFPSVPPDADETEIAQIAERIVHRVPADTAYAMVMGEMCTTVAIIQLLQERGVTCLAATTLRGAHDDDFRFVRWRRYPRIG